jgi:hypothetical protein
MKEWLTTGMDGMPGAKYLAKGSVVKTGKPPVTKTLF